MTYIGAVGRWIHLGEEPLGPCSTSSGWGRFEPAPYSWAEGLAALASEGMAMELYPSVCTSGAMVDPPAPAGS